MLCGPHVSAFQLGIMAFALHDLPMQYVLAAAPGGYQVVTQMLSRRQVQASQVGTASLRDALRRLQHGGMVLTGVDWPRRRGKRKCCRSSASRAAACPPGTSALLSPRDHGCCAWPRVWDPGHRLPCADRAAA